MLNVVGATTVANHKAASPSRIRLSTEQRKLALDHRICRKRTVCKLASQVSSSSTPK